MVMMDGVFWSDVEILLLIVIFGFIVTCIPTLFYAILLSAMVMCARDTKRPYLNAWIISSVMTLLIFGVAMGFTGGNGLGIGFGPLLSNLILLSCCITAGSVITLRMMWRVRNEWKRFRWKALIEDMFGGGV